MDKLKPLLLQLYEKIKSVKFWTGVISLFLLIFTTAGIDISTIDTWGKLWAEVIATISNPYAVLCIAGTLFGIGSNTSKVIENGK